LNICKFYNRPKTGVPGWRRLTFVRCKYYHNGIAGYCNCIIFFSVAKTAPAPAAAKTQPASNQPLASEQEIRNEHTKKVVAPPVIPSQEEKKKE